MTHTFSASAEQLASAHRESALAKLAEASVRSESAAKTDGIGKRSSPLERARRLATAQRASERDLGALRERHRAIGAYGLPIGTTRESARGTRESAIRGPRSVRHASLASHIGLQIALHPSLTYRYRTILLILVYSNQYSTAARADPQSLGIISSLSGAIDDASRFLSRSSTCRSTSALLDPHRSFKSTSGAAHQHQRQRHLTLDTMLQNNGHEARCWLDVPSELRACTQVGCTSLALHSQVCGGGGGGGALFNSVALSRSAEQLCAAEELARLPSTSARNSVPTSPASTSSADRRAHFATRLPVGASALQKRSFEEDTQADGNAAREVKPSTLTKLFTRLHRSRSANTHGDHPVLHSKDVEVRIHQTGGKILYSTAITTTGNSEKPISFINTRAELCELLTTNEQFNCQFEWQKIFI